MEVRRAIQGSPILRRSLDGKIRGSSLPRLFKTRHPIAFTVIWPVRPSPRKMVLACDLTDILYQSDREYNAARPCFFHVPERKTSDLSLSNG
jgi:hypothetical protein